MIYTTCKYAPEELFQGFGIQTARLDPNPQSFSCADGCAHPNLCGFAKAVIEAVKEQEIRQLVLTDCCDAMRRTYDVLNEMWNRRDQDPLTQSMQSAVQPCGTASGLPGEVSFLYFLPLPHKTGEAEIRLFARQLLALKDAYARASGKVFSPDAMLAAWKKSAGCSRQFSGPQNTVLLLGAHGGSMLRHSIKSAFPGTDIQDLTCSGNRFFRESEFPDTFPSVPRESGQTGSAGTVSASALPGSPQHSRSGEAGDLASSGPATDSWTKQQEEALFLWYARQLLEGLTPCMRMFETSPRDRADLNCRGIVYHTIKFCDYYSFEYARLKDTLQVPLLKIETDTTPQSSGQLKTRIEAFGEVMGIEKAARGTSGRKNGPIAGIDSGSTSTDAVILDREGHILGSAILATGMSASRSAQDALALALQKAGLDRSDLSAIVATGYGRDILEMEKLTVTEITCHARGAHFLFPEVRTIIDIGGQDSKVIRIDERGQVLNFIMNDKCAAGTGRFLEMQARALGLSMEDMSRIGLDWKNEVQISNMCTVFAESEVVSLVAKDTAIADIVHGLNLSVAAKTLSLIERGKGQPEYAMTGGVSLNRGVVSCLEQKLHTKVHTSAQSQLCGAIGAALLGLDQTA